MVLCSRVVIDGHAARVVTDGRDCAVAGEYAGVVTDEQAARVWHWASLFAGRQGVFSGVAFLCLPGDLARLSYL